MNKLHSVKPIFMIILSELVTPVEGSGPKTCGGSANGARCFFPFIYKGVTYTSCTNRDHNQLWCATRAVRIVNFKMR